MRTCAVILNDGEDDIAPTQLVYPGAYALVHSYSGALTVQEVDGAGKVRELVVFAPGTWLRVIYSEDI